MKDNKSSKSRRKLLKSIAAGSGVIVAGKSLPESWTRPVVDSVVLPAHAQTSPPSPPSGPSGGSSEITLTSIQNSESMLAHVTDALVKPAHAGVLQPIVIIRWTVCVTTTADPNIYTVQVMYLEKSSDDSFINTWVAAKSLDLAIGETKVIPANQVTTSCGFLWIGGVSVTLNSYADGSGSVGIAVGGASSVNATVNFFPDGCMLDTPICVGGPA